MKWNVKIDFCADGGSYGKTTEYHYYPKARVETSRPLTDGERSRLNDAVIKAIAAELVTIDDIGKK